VKKNLIVLAAFFCMNFPTNAFLQIRKNQIQANIGSRKNISPSLIVPVILITAGTTIVLTNDKTQLDEQIREAIRGITDKALIYVLATSINALLVYPAKYLIGRERPDKSNLVSFPSGHSSNAFVGATYFWNEYQDIHPVLAGTGFANALVTGLFRIYNDKHWASDVICGAGIGILSAHLADWLYPSLKKIVPKSDKIVLKPIASSNEFGIAIDF